MALRMPELGGGLLGPKPARVAAFQAGAHRPLWQGAFQAVQERPWVGRPSLLWAGRRVHVPA